jgi:hypothetical protein
VLVILLAVAGGMLYGSQWFEVFGESVNQQALHTLAAPRSSELARKTEAKRVNASYAATLLKPATKPQSSTVTGSPNRTEEKKPVPVLKAATVVKAHSDPVRTKESPASRTQPKQRNIKAPSVRLPMADFRDNFLAPANEFRIRSYGAASAASVSAPKFFRAADGSLIVRFADGSTRIVRPGERTAEAGTSER